MKKFLKTIGNVLAIPIKFLFCMYCIPAFLLDYFIQVLTGKVKECHRKWKAVWDIVKFIVNKALEGEPITLHSSFGVYAKNDSMIYTRNVTLP